MSDAKAKTVSAFIEGLTILARHMPNGLDQAFAFGAEHDVIHIWGDVCLDSLPEDSEDGRRLQALGFHADSHLDQWQYFT